MTTDSAPRPLFDAHFHIIDPRFPLVANNGYMPDPFTAADYSRRAAELGITGGVVVSGSFQNFDTTYLLDTLAALGSRFVGVANIPDTASDAELERLARAGVRGVRFNLFRGGSASLKSAVTLGQRAWSVAGMHAEFYLDAKDLLELEPVLRSLPRVSIDHLGITAAHRTTLLNLTAAGVRVKATGFGRLNFDIAETMRQIHAVDENALMFGTDLPGTRAPVPFRESDLKLIEHAMPDHSALRRLLCDNATAFYRIPD